MSRNIRLDISPYGCSITDKDRLRVATITDLIKVFKLDTNIETPFLPINCREYIKINKTYILTLEFLPTLRTVEYDGSVDIIEENVKDSSEVVPAKFNIVTPHMLYISILGKEENRYFIRREFLFALKNSLSSYKDELFYCPFCNVSSDHNFCWGDAEKVSSGFTSLIALSSVMDIFFGSVFNGDLDGNFKWNAGAISYKGRIYTFGLFKLLDNKGHFPVEILNPCNLTYESFRESLINNYT